MDALVEFEHPVFGFISVLWETRFDASYDAFDVIRNVADHEPGAPAFYEVPVVYPATIVPSRYGGAYEGHPWLAFPTHPRTLPGLCPGWDDSDVECAHFWGRVRDDAARWPIGGGDSPTEAYESLVAELVSASSAYSTPTPRRD